MTQSLPPDDPTLDLPFAHGGPVLGGRLRASPEDFVVEEQLGYQASGDGEHVFLTVRKRERNTQDVARAIARLADVPQVAIGYAGLKDRNAVTTQHFSVQLPGREAPDWSTIEDESLQVIAAQRHNRKIRRGSLRGNRFRIRVDSVVGDVAEAERQLQRIRDAGVPNYFGSQRFGRGGQNLRRADELLGGRGRRGGREQRSMVLSAARSQLFNQVLAARVNAGTWDTAIAGDVMSLAGSQRQFMYDAADPTIADRLARLDVHPTGPLCGRPGRALQVEADARLNEERALAEAQSWIEGLTRLGLDADRRSLRLVVDGLDWSWQDNSLLLSFQLVAGAFATAVLREIVRSHDADEADPDS